MRQGILLLAFLFLAGCSGAYSGMPSGSFERGEAKFEDESWYDAVEDLRLFIRRSPTDPRAPQAQYMIATSRYKDEDYPVAAVEFEILRNDYPTSDLVDDAWFMQGMCYVQQVPKIELDQTPTRQAVQHFVRYLRENPGGKHREEAEKELDKLNLHLDQKSMAAAQLYRRLRRWRAAAVTADAFLELRPDSELRPEMLLLAGEAHTQTVQWDRARAVYESFLQEYPDHDGVKDARKGLEKIDGAAAFGEDS